MASDTSTSTDVRDDSFVPAIGQYFPASLVNALVLAVLALLATVPLLDPITQLEMFATGFYQLFSLQMLLILFWLLSGTVVESPRFGRLLDAVAGVLPTSQNGIIYATGFLALLLGWVNWAFGLIGGVLVGQRLCQRARENGTTVHYPAVLTAALLALVVTNQGLSSPGGLIMADESGLANFMVEEVGAIGFGEFVLHPVNLISSALFVLTLPLVVVLLAPEEEGKRSTLDERNRILTGSITETFQHYTPGAPREEWEVGDRLENSRLITLIAVALGVVSFGWYFATGGDLTLPWLAFVLMILGLAVHGPPMAFREKTEEATKWARHVAIPFLLYAVVFALLSESGLYDAIGDAIAGSGVPRAVSYVGAFVLGLLVPDPGSVWVIQGPAVAAAEVDLVGGLIATMYGAGISNLWLAFLFAGILSLYGFDWREFARYAAVVTAYVTVVLMVLLAIF